MTKAPILFYFMHDVVGNTETQVTDFDPEFLKQASEAGMIFVAFREDETREIVPYTEVKKPDPITRILPVVTYSYLSEVIDPIINVINVIIEALANRLPILSGIDFKTYIQDLNAAKTKIEKAVAEGEMYDKNESIREALKNHESTQS